jgi:hypothetical protein
MHAYKFEYGHSYVKKLLWNTYACETSCENLFRTVSDLSCYCKWSKRLISTSGLQVAYPVGKTLKHYSFGQSVHEVSRQTVRLRTSFSVCDVVIRPQIAIPPLCHTWKSGNIPKTVNDIRHKFQLTITKSYIGKSWLPYRLLTPFQASPHGGQYCISVINALKKSAMPNNHLYKKHK